MTARGDARLRITKAVLWTVVGIALSVAVARFALGLGATTAMTDATPWGLWKGLHVLAGIALAAGGFVIPVLVHVFRRERYRPLIRTAVLTALMGYSLAIVGLIVDVGQPWRLWHPIVHWNLHSPLFEVAWCVMLYTTILAIEFAPVLFERLRWQRALRVIRPAALVLVVLGASISTLHQSTLGTLFLLTAGRLHPLWYSPILPVLFLVSAVGLGLVVVVVQSSLTSWVFRRQGEQRLLDGLRRPAALVLGLYLLLRLGDLAWRGVLVPSLGGHWTTLLFVVELGACTLLPILLFLLPAARKIRWAHPVGATLAACGFILNRAAVGGIAHVPFAGELYLPGASEVAMSVGLVAGMALAFLLAVEHLPVWPGRTPAQVRASTMVGPGRDATGVRGFLLRRARVAALCLVVGAAAGAALVAATASGEEPLPRPVLPARAIALESGLDPIATPAALRLVASVEAAGVVPSRFEEGLLIDGDRAGMSVVFSHGAHQRLLGGDSSCVTCHHQRDESGRGMSCAVCHRDMYRITSDWASRVRPAPAPEPASGPAIGYRAAMHQLCIGCHESRDEAAGRAAPALGRCTTCHRGALEAPLPAPQRPLEAGRPEADQVPAGRSAGLSDETRERSEDT